MIGWNVCCVTKGVAIAAVCRELRRLQVVRKEHLVEQTRLDAYASMERICLEISALKEQMVIGELEPKDFEGEVYQICAILQKL